MKQVNLTIQITSQINQNGGGKPKDDPDGGFFFLIITIIIGAVAVVSGVSIYYYRKSARSKSPRMMNQKKAPKIVLDSPQESSRKFKSSIDNKLLLNKFEAIRSPEDLTPLEGIQLTMISENFLNKIDELNIKEKDKKELLTEMFSLTPEERNKIINKMLKKQKGE